MNLIDTHNHLYLPDFDQDRDEVVKRSVADGVTKILMPNIDSSSVQPMLDTETRYPGICMPMMGLHPTSVKGDYLIELDSVEKQLLEHRYFGIGETGIDLYWDKTYYAEQLISFRRHLELAEMYTLPLVIHSRDSIDVVFKELRAFGPERITGVFHAFPGGAEEALIAVEMGFMIGVGGVVTFRNSKLGEAVLEAGINNIVLETDAPYLAPAPHRGKRNESSYLTLVIAKLSEILRISPAEVASRTSANAAKLFGI